MKSGHACLAGHLGTCDIFSASVEKHSNSTGGRSSHQRCSVEEKVFAVISQNSQETTCARASFLIKLQATSLTGKIYLIKSP